MTRKSYNLKRVIYIPLLGIIFTFFCYGCRLGPSYDVPYSPIPEDWKNPHKDCQTPYPQGFWWEVFNDDLLNQLEEQAIENNHDLFIAAERVVEARALAGVRQSDLYPHINVNPNYSNTGVLFKLFLPSTIIPGTGALKRVFRIHQVEYNLPFNLSYEVDLWGKIKGLYTSAALTAEAQGEALCTLMLTLTTELASNYFQLRSLDTQIDVLQSTISVREKLLKLAQSRFDNGLINHIDVFNATLQLSNAQAEYANNMRLRNLQENALAVLIGLPSPLFSLQHHPLTNNPPVIPASLPSEVLHQRPDIAQAERNMEAQHALIGVAYASFFPSLYLTGTLGFSSPDLKDFMTWQSRFWSYGFNSAQTIFDAGRNCANLSASWARFSQARNAYQKQVLIAFREVEDALNNLEMQHEQSLSLQVALSSSQKTTQLSQSRYFKGLTNSFEFIEAERSALEAQLNVTNLLGLRYLSTIQLIKALGGSWNSECH